MYLHEEGYVEDLCYDYDHVESVLDKIRKNFDKNFDKFIETEAGLVPSADEFGELIENLHVSSLLQSAKKSNYTAKYKSIIKEAIDDFEKDRKSYIDIFDEELLEEYEDAPANFKAKVLRDYCPIIRKVMRSKTKEMGKYRHDFSIANPNELLEVIKRLCAFGTEYSNSFDSWEEYEQISDYEELGMGCMDTEEYTVYKVIGGGIKSHIMYKVHPEFFANRSRGAIWALWYLTEKAAMDCSMDSEFIMINCEKNITQQNYFYPYELFSYYAFRIYKLLKAKAEGLDVYIDPEYRYVIVDKFLQFVADEHEEEINFFQTAANEGGGVDYA